MTEDKATAGPRQGGAKEPDLRGWRRRAARPTMDVLASRLRLRGQAALRWVRPEMELSSEDVGGHEWSRQRPAHRLRLMTLNVAHGRRLSTHQAFLRRRTVERNLFAIASTLRRERPDIVALQEADGPSAWSGNFDHVATLARLGRVPHHFRGRHNPLEELRLPVSAGTAVLSQTELLEASSHRFRHSWRDTKGFVVATVPSDRFGGQAIDVVSVHLEFLSPHVRRRQISKMVEVLRDRDLPRVILGDLNCCSEIDPGCLRILEERLGLRAFEADAGKATYPSSNPVLRLDWILISPELRFVDYRVLPNPLSDHLGVVADIELA